MTAQVLVVEDEPDIANVLQAALGQAGLRVAIAANARAARGALRDRAPDVILLDLQLPDADGLDLVEPFSAVAPVIVLTGRDHDESIVVALQRGADDYVVKPFSPRVLVARVEVVRRRRADRPQQMTHGRLVIDLDRRRATLGARDLGLTRRELDLLAHLAREHGRAVGREELLQAVWQSSADWQTAATVTEHVRRLRIKLGEPGWIDSIRGVGYRFTAQE